jgi:hypothetical protein
LLAIAAAINVPAANSAAPFIIERRESFGLSSK